MTRTKRILEHEYESFVTSPLDYIKVNFEEGTYLEWHFLFIGQIGTPFEGGEYHGTLVFPDNYPFSPPSTRFITPNGRFQINERVCFSISDFHPENWKPAYTVSSFLQGVYSFMMTETSDTVGSLDMDEEEVRKLARLSKEFNKHDESYNKMFKEEIDETIESSLNILQMPKTGDTPNSLTHDKNRITSVASDSLKEFSSKKSQPNLNADKYYDNVFKISDNFQIHKPSHAFHFLTDRKNRYPPQFFNVTCSADLVAVPFLDNLKDAINFNATKLQMPLPFAANSSSTHQSSMDT